MPDSILYVQAFIVVASVCGLVVLPFVWRAESLNERWVSRACVAGIALGHVAGCFWLRLTIGWPPVNALDRYLVILLPTVAVVELLVTLPRCPRWGACLLRMLLAASLGRVLLHRSVYLDEWTALRSLVSLAVCAGLTIVVWLLLARLADRAPGISIPLALALTIQGAGAAIMLAGYLKGGAAAMVASAAVLGASLACVRVSKHVPLRALVGFGVVSLSGLLLIGVFFGRLSTAGAFVLLGAPLMCWVTEFRWCRPRSAMVVGITRLTFVAAMVAIVLLVAVRKFEREFRPLLFRMECLRPILVLDPVPKGTFIDVSAAKNHDQIAIARQIDLAAH